MIPRFTASIIRLTSILLVLWVITIAPAGAALLRDVPQAIVQPDGTVLNCLATGDEHYHWLHDTDGYVIVQDPKTGFFVYASETSSDLAPTKHIAGKANPRALGLKKNARPSPKRLRDIIDASRNLYDTSTAKPFNSKAAGLNAPSASISKINNIVVFIRFSDESEFTDAVSYYDWMFNSTSSGINSMNNYFTEASYGKFSVDSTFYPATAGTTVVSYQDTHVRKYYQPYNAITNPDGYTGGDNGNGRTNREHTLLTNAIGNIASQVPSDLNIDEDNDGNVDNICFIIKGSTSGWGSLLWPHMWSLYSQTALIHGKQVWDYNFQLQVSTSTSVLCHEMCHTLKFPDLYHYYNSTSMKPVYYWDIMEYNGSTPQHMGAYMKFRYVKWIDSIPEITTNGTYTLNPLTSPTGNCYMIQSPRSSTEYYVLEYRRKTGTFERSIPGSGLLVYRINTARDGLGNQDGPPDEVYIYRPGGTTTANGSPGNANFSSDYGRTTINDYTNPSGFLSDGTTGGLSITNIGAIGDTISFAVNMFGVDTPTFTPDGGVYGSPQSVTISCPTPGAVIHYTTNGVIPTESDPTVDGRIIIDHSLILKAKAYIRGVGYSSLKTASYSIVTPISIAEAKRLPDGGTVATTNSVVTSVLGGNFYIEAEDRSSAIEVSMPGHGLTVGVKVSVAGVMNTDDQFERFIQASSAVQDGTGTIKPLMLNNYNVGGSGLAYNPSTGAGQIGITSHSGLNNIGLLVTVTGRFTSSGAGMFYIDDGSGLIDNTGFTGLRISAPGLTPPQNGAYVMVTGISSCFNSSSVIYPQVKVQRQEDIVPIN